MWDDLRCTFDVRYRSCYASQIVGFIRFVVFVGVEFDEVRVAVIVVTIVMMMTTKKMLMMMKEKYWLKLPLSSLIYYYCFLRAKLVKDFWINFKKEEYILKTF